MVASLVLPVSMASTDAYFACIMVLARRRKDCNFPVVAVGTLFGIPTEFLLVGVHYAMCSSS